VLFIAILIGLFALVAILTYRHIRAVTVAGFVMGISILLLAGTPASAAIVPTVPLGTSANYSVLGASTVTNTGPSTLAQSLGLWPGTSITGFPPGLVTPPGTTDTTNAAAHQAQSDLTAAYLNAAGRPIDATTTADLANLNLGAGVYAAPSKGAMALNGPLTLNGAGNSSSVFIFQTNSTLITGSGSSVSLTNGAQACNVFWQVGSSATLGTSSVFVGNILALTSITVNTGVTVQGRALAQNGAVTLDDDTFVAPGCATSGGGGGTTTTTTTTVPLGGGVTPTTPGGTPTTPGGTPTTPGGTPTTPGGTPTTPGGTPTGTSTLGTGTTVLGTTTQGSTTITSPPSGLGIVGVPFTGGGPPQTGGFPWFPVLLAGIVATAGTVGVVQRRRIHLRHATRELG
jgi:hypothetical protein